MALEAKANGQTYNDGASALTALKTSPPDLAILDIKMPRMDGMELLRRLRQNSDMPVIILTSKDEEIDEMFGLKMGADDYIHKPFCQRLLVERVKAVLRRVRRRGATSRRPPAEAGAAGARARQADARSGAPRLPLGRQAGDADGDRVPACCRRWRQRPGFVKSRDSLMDAAYDDQVYVDDRTIDSHIKRMRKKFKRGRRRVRRDRDPLWRRIPLQGSLTAAKADLRQAQTRMRFLDDVRRGPPTNPAVQVGMQFGTKVAKL